MNAKNVKSKLVIFLIKIVFTSLKIMPNFCLPGIALCLFKKLQ